MPTHREAKNSVPAGEIGVWPSALVVAAEEEKARRPWGRANTDIGGEQRNALRVHVASARLVEAAAPARRPPKQATAAAAEDAGTTKGGIDDLFADCDLTWLDSNGLD